MTHGKWPHAAACLRAVDKQARFFTDNRTQQREVLHCVSSKEDKNLVHVYGGLPAPGDQVVDLFAAAGRKLTCAMSHSMTLAVHSQTEQDRAAHGTFCSHAAVFPA